MTVVTFNVFVVIWSKLKNTKYIKLMERKKLQFKLEEKIIYFHIIKAWLSKYDYLR